MCSVFSCSGTLSCLFLHLLFGRGEKQVWNVVAGTAGIKGGKTNFWKVRDCVADVAFTLLLGNF